MVRPRPRSTAPTAGKHSMVSNLVKLSRASQDLTARRPRTPSSPAARLSRADPEVRACSRRRVRWSRWR
ncbi:hypothetical protein ABZ639_07335 [Saccharomonospora sp. NPDC006951]